MWQMQRLRRKCIDAFTARRRASTKFRLRTPALDAVALEPHAVADLQVGNAVLAHEAEVAVVHAYRIFVARTADAVLPLAVADRARECIALFASGAHRDIQHQPDRRIGTESGRLALALLLGFAD